MKRLLLLTASVLSQLSDDEDFEASGESSGDFDPTYSEKPQIRLDKSPSEASLFDHFVNKKFLAAVIAGSCVGLLLASMAMTLVLCKARRDSSLRRYDYQAGKSHLY